MHVGAPKSGTTFLQTILWGNRLRLGESGVLVPGGRPFDLNRAAKVIRQPSFPKAGDAGPVWRRLVRQVAAFEGDAVLSNEWFSLAPTDAAEAALAHLAPAQVHVVFTARAAVHQVPAAWQETLKLGHGRSLTEFIRDLDRPGERWSWWSLDAAEVLERWGSSVPAERVHVVTVPARGSDPLLLWRRFATVCGIDPDSCDTDVASANESLGVESARLLQELGPQLREAVGGDSAHWTEQYRWLRRYLGHELLVPRGGSRIGLHDDELKVLGEHSAHTRQALAAAGYDVVGDLAELEQPPTGGVHPDDVSAESLLEVAGPLIAALLGRLRQETLRAERAEGRRDIADVDRPNGGSV